MIILHDRSTGIYQEAEEGHTLTQHQEFVEFDLLREHIRIAITEQGYYDRRSEHQCCRQE